MPRKSRPKDREIFTLLSVKVERRDARVETSIHSDLRSQRPVFDRPTDPVYEVRTMIEVSGVVVNPDTRQGERFDLTILGEISTEPPLVLKDMQATDDDRRPMFKAYRGVQYPLYVAPRGLALLQRLRGQPGWSAWIFAAPRLLSDMLTLLSSPRQLYLSVHEKKTGRERWVQSLSLQTSDPANE